MSRKMEYTVRGKVVSVWVEGKHFTDINHDDIDCAEKLMNVMDGAYRAGFVDGVNVMAEAAKTAGTPIGGGK